jgi:hypothetical protein
MIPVTQTLFGKAEGNCLAACVASILELDLADVPNFCADQSDGSWLRRLADWLAERALCAVHASFVDGDPGVVPAPEDLATMRAWMKLRRVGFAIVSGYTTRGLSHSTVWFDGELVHDPHPSQDPLINVVDMVVIAHRDLRALDHEHLTETAGLISNAAAVREQHSNRIDRLLGRIETLEAEIAGINKMGAELAVVLGEDDPHHPLDVLAASVMHSLREARAEVARLRTRVRVEAEDVERAGVTWAHVEPWLRANGWVKVELGYWRSSALMNYDFGPGETAVDTTNKMAAHYHRAALDILDEMAAIEVPS